MNVENKKIATQVLKNAKEYCRYQDTSGLRQSRRVGGPWDTSVEERGFKAVYVYLDIRLADRADQICEILEYVDSKLPRQRLCYRHLFTFGWPDEVLHYAVKVKSSSYPVRKTGWRKMIGDIETSAIESATGIIPDLLPPRDPGKFPSVFRKPKMGDLFLWFVDGNSGHQYTGHRGKAWSAAKKASVAVKIDQHDHSNVVSGKDFLEN